MISLGPTPTQVDASIAKSFLSRRIRRNDQRSIGTKKPQRRMYCGTPIVRPVPSQRFEAERLSPAAAAQCPHSFAQIVGIDRRSGNRRPRD